MSKVPPTTDTETSEKKASPIETSEKEESQIETSEKTASPIKTSEKEEGEEDITYISDDEIDSESKDDECFSELDSDLRSLLNHCNWVINRFIPIYVKTKLNESDKKSQIMLITEGKSIINDIPKKKLKNLIETVAPEYSPIFTASSKIKNDVVPFRKSLRFFIKAYNKIDPENRGQILELFKKTVKMHTGSIITKDYKNCDWLRGEEEEEDLDLSELMEFDPDDVDENPSEPGHVYIKMGNETSIIRIYLSHIYKISIWLREYVDALLPEDSEDREDCIELIMPEIIVYYYYKIISYIKFEKTTFNSIINENIKSMENDLDKNKKSSSGGLGSLMDTISGITSKLGIPMDSMDEKTMDGFSETVNRAFNDPKAKGIIGDLFNSLENNTNPGDILGKIVESFSNPEFQKSFSQFGQGQKTEQGQGSGQGQTSGTNEKKETLELQGAPGQNEAKGIKGIKGEEVVSNEISAESDEEILMDSDED